MLKPTTLHRAPQLLAAFALLLTSLVPLAASAATPEEESRFLDAVRHAYAARDAAELSKVTCWDNSPEPQKKDAEQVNVELMKQKDVTYEVKLTDPDKKEAAKDRTEKGVVYRFNLPVTKQIELTMRDPKDKKILGIITFAVGEKDGKLLLATLTPVK